MEETIEFKDCMAMRFRRLGRLMSNQYNEHLKGHGIDISLLNILFAVAGNPGIHQVEIGQRLILERRIRFRFSRQTGAIPPNVLSG